MEDWRITNQHQYLDGVTLVWDHYSTDDAWDHDHCELCWAKFPEDESAGYRTRDSRHWICKRCFEDFKEDFSWTVAENGQPAKNNHLEN